MAKRLLALFLALMLVSGFAVIASGSGIGVLMEYPSEYPTLRVDTTFAYVDVPFRSFDRNNDFDFSVGMKTKPVILDMGYVGLQARATSLFNNAKFKSFNLLAGIQQRSFDNLVFYGECGVDPLKLPNLFNDDDVKFYVKSGVNFDIVGFAQGFTDTE